MKVCIIGNNLTSLILANILSQKKFNVEIYYKKTPKSEFKTRTLGISKYNLKYLEMYFKNIKNKTKPIDDIKVIIKNNKINKEISFNKNSSTLFNMIKYDNLVSYLKKKSNKNKYLSFKNINKKFDLLSLLNDKKFDLIINCEANNILTKKYMNELISKNYNNKAFTTIINHSKIKNDKAIQIFTEYGPIAFLPLSDKSTSIVFSIEMKNLQISKDEICKLIKKFNPIYKIVSQENLESFDLKLKLPKKYFYKNILFFGDSLHSIHPLAGQGFNMTIRDMIRFDELINKKINLGLSIDKSIYSEFEKISKAYNSSFSFGIDFIYEFFRFNKKFIPKNISEEVFNFINNSKKIKNISIKIADQGFF